MDRLCAAPIVVVLLATIACRGDPPAAPVSSDPAKPSPSPSHSAPAPVDAPANATTATSTAAAVEDAAPSTSASDHTLPPPNDACRAVDDCDYDYVYLLDGQCCGGTCAAKPSSKARLARIRALCTAWGWNTANCPTKKCKPAPPLACVAGKCVFTP